ncbi:MAG: thermonuclease family protein [Synechococcaceae cyanobacterium RM1_1_27]|nr:thermonuclease family protein [Synechococcaceae cyanobacterium RM1_1_27]
MTDGDTIRAKQPGGRSVRIRLACIDAPEKKQPLGLSSRDALQALVPIGSVVTLNVTDIDRYDRPVAEIYNGSVLVQLQMVRSGMAYVYEKYLKNCPLSAKSLMEAEDQARRIRMGVWSDPSAIKPWDFRKSNR